VFQFHLQFHRRRTKIIVACNENDYDVVNGCGSRVGMMTSLIFLIMFDVRYPIKIGFICISIAIDPSTILALLNRQARYTVCFNCIHCRQVYLPTDQKCLTCCRCPLAYGAPHFGIYRCQYPPHYAYIFAVVSFNPQIISALCITVC